MMFKNLLLISLAFISALGALPCAASSTPPSIASPTGLISASQANFDDNAWCNAKGKRQFCFGLSGALIGISIAVTGGYLVLWQADLPHKGAINLYTYYSGCCVFGGGLGMLLGSTIEEKTRSCCFN